MVDGKRTLGKLVKALNSRTFLWIYRAGVLAAFARMVWHESMHFERTKDGRRLAIVAVMTTVLMLIFVVNDRDRGKMSAQQSGTDVPTAAPPR